MQIYSNAAVGGYAAFTALAFLKAAVAAFEQLNKGYYCTGKL